MSSQFSIIIIQCMDKISFGMLSKKVLFFLFTGQVWMDYWRIIFKCLIFFSSPSLIWLIGFPSFPSVFPLKEFLFLGFFRHFIPFWIYRFFYFIPHFLLFYFLVVISGFCFQFLFLMSFLQFDGRFSFNDCVKRLPNNNFPFFSPLNNFLSHFSCSFCFCRV